MPKVNLETFLETQVLHLLDGLRRPNTPDRDREIDQLVNETRALIQISRNGNKKIAEAGVDLLSKKIEALVVYDPQCEIDPLL